MLNDKAGRIGCATAKCEEERKYHYYMTCNYDSTNIGGLYVYMIGGPAASDCSFYGGVPSMRICAPMMVKYTHTTKINHWPILKKYKIHSGKAAKLVHPKMCSASVDNKLVFNKMLSY